MRAWLLLGFTFLTLTACGYHNPYTSVDEDIKGEIAIHAALWTNQSNELGLEARIHQAVSDWLQESKHVKLVDGRDKADYTIEGKVLQVDSPASSFNTFDKAVAVRSVVNVTYSFTDLKAHQTLWSESATREATYSVGSDAVRTQSSKQLALNTIADGLAEQIYMRIFYTLSREMKRADRKKIVSPMPATAE